MKNQSEWMFNFDDFLFDWDLRWCSPFYTNFDFYDDKQLNTHSTQSNSKQGKLKEIPIITKKIKYLLHYYDKDDCYHCYYIINYIFIIGISVAIVTIIANSITLLWLRKQIKNK